MSFAGSQPWGAAGGPPRALILGQALGLLATQLQTSSPGMPLAGQPRRERHGPRRAAC